MVEQVTTDFRSASLDPETLALLEFAEKVTLTPSQVVDEDLEKLRQAGFSDDDIYLTFSRSAGGRSPPRSEGQLLTWLGGENE